MNKIKLSGISLSLACLSLCFQSCQYPASKDKKISKPNIVLIFIDDMGLWRYWLFWGNKL